VKINSSLRKREIKSESSIILRIYVQLSSNGLVELIGVGDGDGMDFQFDLFPAVSGAIQTVEKDDNYFLNEQNLLILTNMLS